VPAIQILDDLPAMATFACVVESRSFTGASRVLGTTTSSVSKRVANLEDRLGVRLLVRTTRSFVPTEAGLTFYDRCARILRDVGDAELAMTELGNKPRGTLRVCAPTCVGEALVAPLTAAFRAACEDVSVELDLDDGPVDPVSGGYDVVLKILRDGALPDSSVVARRLTGVGRLVLCGSPSYFAARGVPAAPHELVDHLCLHHTAVPLHVEWSFETPNGVEIVLVKAPARFNNVAALRAAGIAGAGLLRTSLASVSAALEVGALRTVLDEFSGAEHGLYAMYPAGKHPSAKVRAYVEQAVRELRRA
jgi:DNA-binding transcriptional LysR family regulator